MIRRTASVPGSGAAVLSPTVLGLSATALTRLHWRSDFSSRLARRSWRDASAPTGRRSCTACALPAGATTVSLPVRIRGVAVRLDLAAEDAEHRVVLLPLGQKGPGSWQLSATVPAGVRQIVGLEISLTNAAAYVLQHREAEGRRRVGAFGLVGARLAVGGRAGAHRVARLAGARRRCADRPHGLLFVHLRPDDASAPAAGDRQPSASRHRQSRGRAREPGRAAR